MQETGSKIHPCSRSSSRKMSRHFFLFFFFRGKTVEAVPLTGLYHTAAAAAAVWHCMQTAVRRTDRKMDRQREGEREREHSVLFTAGFIPQLLHHAQTQLFI